MIVIFDLDGTLIDSAPDIHATANTVLAEDGLGPLDLATVRGFVGRGVPHLVDRLLEAHGVRDPARAARMVAAFTDRYEAAVTLTRPYPGVPAALAALTAAGHTLGICTNKPVAPARAILRHLGLLDVFSVIIGGDSLRQRKPDPAPLILAIEDAAVVAGGAGPSLYVGDSEVDAQTAQAAGIPLALFSGGYRKTPIHQLPHRVAFDDFGQLSGIVADMLDQTARPARA